MPRSTRNKSRLGRSKRCRMRRKSFNALDSAFEDNIDNANDNLQAMIDMTQNAWAAFAHTMSESTAKTESKSLGDALKAGLAFVPQAEIFLKGLDLTMAAGEWYESLLSPSAKPSRNFGREVAQLQDITHQINKREDVLTAIESLYEAAENRCDKSRIARIAFRTPVRKLSAVEKDKLYYATLYKLFQNYCKKHVKFVRYPKHSYEGAWEARGLTADQEAEIYKLFGGKKYVNYSGHGDRVRKAAKAWWENDRKALISVGWKMHNARMPPIFDAQSMIKGWQIRTWVAPPQVAEAFYRPLKMSYGDKVRAGLNP